MSRFKLLALDIDGTLVNSRDELTPATSAAIRQACDAGIRVVLATGRRYSKAIHLVEPLGLDVPLISASEGDHRRTQSIIARCFGRSSFPECWKAL